MNIFNNCKCIYCTEYDDFPVLWELSTGVLWFEIPKNGSFSIKKTYNKRKLINNTEAYHDIKPHVVLRDPIDRFLSLFKHYFLPEGGRFRRGRGFCERLNKDINYMDIHERLEFLFDNLGKLNTDDEVHHFYPQVYFIDFKHFNNFNFIHINELTKTLKIPVRNHTRTNTIVNLTKEQKKYIKEIYKDDYAFFKKYNLKFE